MCWINTNWMESISILVSQNDWYSFRYIKNKLYPFSKVGLILVTIVIELYLLDLYVDNECNSCCIISSFLFQNLLLQRDRHPGCCRMYTCISLMGAYVCCVKFHFPLNVFFGFSKKVELLRATRVGWNIKYQNEVHSENATVLCMCLFLVDGLHILY